MGFPGFPREGVAFLAELAAHNDRVWFAAHKQRYQTLLLAPAQAFVVALGDRIRQQLPTIQVDSRTDGRGVLMRLTRDTRFSADKTPYKTDLSGIFWEGRGEKLTTPAFGFRLQADGMDLMVGMLQFPPPLLAAFRAAVADPPTGSALHQILSELQTQPGYQIQGEQYQRVPAGYAANHPRADVLRYKGMAACPPRVGVDLLCSAQVVDVCVAHFERLIPFHHWLMGVYAANSVSDPPRIT